MGIECAAERKLVVQELVFWDAHRAFVMKYQIGKRDRVMSRQNACHFLDCIPELARTFGGDVVRQAAELLRGSAQAQMSPEDVLGVLRSASTVGEFWTLG